MSIITLGGVVTYASDGGPWGKFGAMNDQRAEFIVNRISSKLDLNAVQKQNLIALKDTLKAQREAHKQTNPRAEVMKLLATPVLDETKVLSMLDEINNWQNSTIFLSGVGTSTLVDELAIKNTHLVLNDISNKALNRVKERLGRGEQDSVWLCQDISHPIEQTIPDIDIWIDRAVLHFLMDEKSIQGYFDNLRSNLVQDGYAIFAEFSQTGAEKCAGLSIHQYSVDELAERLGASFKLLSQFDSIYINPRGEERPYIYALFQKQENI